MSDFSKFLDASPTVREDKIIAHLAELVERAAQTNALLAALLDATNLNVSTVSQKEDHHGKETSKSKKRK